MFQPASPRIQPLDVVARHSLGSSVEVELLEMCKTGNRKGSMRRFLSNRMWTILLALTFGVTGFLMSPSSTFAAGSVGGVQGGGSGDPIDPNAPDPNATGDPDSPANGGRASARPGVAGGQVGVFGMHRAGDATMTERGVWVVRFRIAMKMLKAYYLRF